MAWVTSLSPERSATAAEDLRCFMEVAVIEDLTQCATRHSPDQDLAHRRKSLPRHSFDKVFTSGEIRNHPILGVELNGESQKRHISIRHRTNALADCSRLARDNKC